MAVDSTQRGPAVGGCRVQPYPGWRAALEDALRLSRAMTVKCRLAGLPCGGGKLVAASPAGVMSADHRDALLDDIAGVVAGMDGSYVTGPDIGTTCEDMAVIHRRAHGGALCRPEHDGGSGDSAPATARGVLAAAAAALTHIHGSESVQGLRVGILGYGSVGRRIASTLSQAGACVAVTDTDQELETTAAEAGLEWSGPELASADLDILVPAATGGLLTRDFAASCRAKLIVGPANNQLHDVSSLELMARRGITWIPDVAASAGGIINAVCRESLGLSEQEAVRRVEAVRDTVADILARADQQGRTPFDVVEDQPLPSHESRAS